MPIATANGINWNYTIYGAGVIIGTNSGVYNSFNNGNATDQGTAIAGAIVIPSTLDGYSVIGMCARAFAYCVNLTSVTIPNTVTVIGNTGPYGFEAFRQCTNLTSVTILGNSLTTFGDLAFFDCAKLTNFTIPNSVTTIRDSAFYGCRMFTSVIIPSLVTTIAGQAFASCTALTSINIPNSVTSIGIDAFYNTAINLTVTINNNKTIGTTTFTSPATNVSFFGPVMSVRLVLPLPPVMTITSTDVTSGSSTKNTPITLSLTSSEATSNFAIGDISVTNGALNTFSGSGALYTATFTPQNQGVCTINVPANVYSVAVGNNTASTPFTFTFDSVLPTMTITSTTPGVTNGSSTKNATIALTFTSSEATTNFVVGDISVTNGTITSPLSGSGSVYTAIFTPAGQGACTIGVASGAYTDAAENSNTASNTFNWTFDTVSPSMTITSTTITSGSTTITSGLTTNNAFIELTFTSTEATTNFVVGDISVTNGTLSNFAGIGTDGKVYNAIFTPANEGACTINVAAGAYTDAATNLNNLATQFNWTFSTAWNSHTTANHLIKSYIKDFIDVSGMVVLRENSNLYISGNMETAGNVSLNRLFVTADASFNRRIFVGGDVSMNGNVNVSGDLSMNGTVTKCSFNNSSISKSAFSGTVPDGADYTTPKIVYDQTFQANDDVSMNGSTFAANNVTVSGNIVFNDGTVMNTYDNNILSTNPTVFNSSTFTALDICGNLVAGSYATSSDYRIKTNIVELDETYNVDKLRPVKYFQTQINREKYGLIAHELQEHYPDLVIGEKDGSELQRVNYTGLIAILINEIKRLKQNLAELESGI